jgi:hypothetical protein
MPLQMPHVSVCDLHNELPQSKHCVLAVLEQGKPSASATFRTSTTSQRLMFAPLTAQSRPFGTGESANMPSRNRLVLALTFKQFLSAALLRIFPIHTYKSSATIPRGFRVTRNSPSYRKSPVLALVNFTRTVWKTGRSCGSISIVKRPCS